MKKKKVIQDRIIAKGEMTGHAHRMDQAATVYEEEDGIFFQNDKPSTISHEEHKPITFNPKEWATGIVVEYDHFLEESRNVAD